MFPFTFYATALWLDNWFSFPYFNFNGIIIINSIMYAAAPQVRSTVPEPMCTDPLKLMCLSFETMTNSNRNICVIFDVMRMLNSVADYMPLSIGAASQPASQTYYYIHQLLTRCVHSSNVRLIVAMTSADIRAHIKSKPTMNGHCFGMRHV